MMQYSSSEDDIEVEFAVVNNNTCTDTVHEVMEEAFGEVTAEVKNLKMFEIQPKSLIFLCFRPDRILLLSKKK